MSRRPMPLADANPWPRPRSACDGSPVCESPLVVARPSAADDRPVLPRPEVPDG